MARGRNEVTLTFAGDSDQLERAFDRVGAASKKMDTEVRTSAQSFDKAAEATDTLDTRSMGFNDTLTGVQDSMAGTAAIARGDYFEGFLLAGQGTSDLASGATNLLVPALKNAHAGMIRAKDATLAWAAAHRGATLALGALGVAITAAVVIWQAFRNENDQVAVSVEKLTVDLDRMANGGRVTGELLKILGDDAGDLRGRLEALDPTLRANRSGWDSLLDTFRVTHAEQELLRDDLAELDEGLAALVESGGDGAAALRELADHYELTDDQMRHVISALPRYQQELKRAEDRTRDAAAATFDHLESLQALGDELQAQTDPIFAFVRAQESVTEAQHAMTEAADEFGRNSPEYERAVLDLAEAELGLMDAAGNAAGAVDATLLPTLESMRDQGVLSQEAFDRLAGAIEDTRVEADRLDGTRVRIHEEVIQSFRNVSQASGSLGGRAVPVFHDGGVVPGPPGSETLALLEAGETITPAGQSPRSVIEIHSGGAPLDDLLVEILAGAVRGRGGDVQLVLGGARG